jgi:putative endonuclease
MYFVYILSNHSKSVLYIGVTNNLIRRVYEHQHSLVKGFTERYNVKELIYFEEFNQIIDAITREKQLKNWHHEWKINLVKSNNPELKDLSKNIF